MSNPQCRVKFAPISDCNIPYTTSFSIDCLPQHSEQMLDVFVPSSFLQTSALLPVVLLIHGGSQSFRGEDGKRIAKTVASAKNCIVVQPHYQVGAEFEFQRFNDTVLALHWTVKNIVRYQGNNENIHCVGIGMGVNLAQGLSTTGDGLAFIRNTVFIEEKQVKQGEETLATQIIAYLRV